MGKDGCRDAPAAVQHFRNAGRGWGTGMGLLDRDYYRDDEGGPIANWFRHGLVTKILFAINAVVFIIQIATQDRGLHTPASVSGPFSNALALNAEKLLHFEAWRLISYAFLTQTDSIFPFLFNMPILWVAGHQVEDRLGRQRFVAFYLTSAVVAGVMMAGASVLGLFGSASDATFAVGCTAPVTTLLAWLALQSRRTTLTFFHSLTVPAWLLLAISIVCDIIGQVWPRVAQYDGRRVTLVGHFGGLLAAIVFQAILQSTRGFRGKRRAAAAQTDPDLRIYRDDSRELDEDEAEEMPAAVGSKSDVDEHLEAQLDAVLAKVAQHGQSSLTSAEREILNRASEVYRKRRR